MGSSVPLAKAILGALNPSTGGVYSGGTEVLLSLLRSRGVSVEEEALHEGLERLASQGRVERVETDDGTTVYTRPEMLLAAPGVVTVLSGPSRRKRAPRRTPRVRMSSRRRGT